MDIHRPDFVVRENAQVKAPRKRTTIEFAYEMQETFYLA